jgi:hypothetical protein
LKVLHETDPLVACEGSTTAFPETKESCEKFVSAGVSLERTWTPSDGGRLISMTDTWRSTDAKPHTVSALYSQELASDLVSPGTYQFPGGVAGFAASKTGQTHAVTAGEGAILYRENGAATETVGGKDPVGAITFDTAPSGPLQVTAGSAETSGVDSFQMPYTLELAASGTRKLTIAFAQGYTLAEVCALAEQANSGCQPSVAITSPVSGGTTGFSSIRRLDDESLARPRPEHDHGPRDGCGRPDAQCHDIGDLRASRAPVHDSSQATDPRRKRLHRRRTQRQTWTDRRIRDRRAEHRQHRTRIRSPQ